IVVDLKVPVLAIAGNHDSPNRLHFGSHMMKQSGYHIVGNLNKTIEKVTYEDEFGPVHFYLVPYADPAQVRNLYEDDTIQTFDDATRRIVDDIKQEMDPNDRHVLLPMTLLRHTVKKKLIRVKVKNLYPSVGQNM